MAAKFVHPYSRSQKNYGNDAEAICEAVGRPKMRFVPVKSAEQALLAIHRVRAELVGARTALINQLRGLLIEFGIALPKGRSVPCASRPLSQRRARSRARPRGAHRAQRTDPLARSGHSGLRPTFGCAGAPQRRHDGALEKSAVDASG